MNDRAAQACQIGFRTRMGSAQFEPNSYGFRPGRATHDAFEAYLTQLGIKPIH